MPDPSDMLYVLFLILVIWLAIELWNPENKRLRGSIAPVFYTSAGEVRRHPERFDDAIRKITGALACLGCKHTHVAVPPPVTTGGAS